MLYLTRPKNTTQREFINQILLYNNEVSYKVTPYEIWAAVVKGSNHLVPKSLHLFTFRFRLSCIINITRCSKLLYLVVVIWRRRLFDFNTISTAWQSKNTFILFSFFSTKTLKRKESYFKVFLGESRGTNSFSWRELLKKALNRVFKVYAFVEIT